MTINTAPENGALSVAPARNRSKRSKRNKTGKQCPAVCQAMRAFWQDPERVADWKQKHAARMEARRADPDKAWSRRGIPNGYARASGRHPLLMTARFTHFWIV